MQDLLVAQFHPNLTDLGGANVLTRLFGFFQAQLIGRRNSSDVANQMTPGFTQGVTAKQPSPHLDPWQAKAIRRQNRDFFIG